MRAPLIKSGYCAEQSWGWSVDDAQGRSIVDVIGLLVLVTAALTLLPLVMIWVVLDQETWRSFRQGRNLHEHDAAEPAEHRSSI